MTVAPSLRRPPGPRVICLACAASDVARRCEEIETLVRELGGRAEVQSVTGRTTALAVSLPPAHAERFAAALALIGATIIEGDVASQSPEFLVVMTIEHRLPEWKDT
jgi:hypothetical protein